MTSANSNTVQDCPHCPNQGWYAVPNRNTGDAEQQQCEFCYTTPNSRFNADARDATPRSGKP